MRCGACASKGAPRARALFLQWIVAVPGRDKRRISRRAPVHRPRCHHRRGGLGNIAGFPGYNFCRPSHCRTAPPPRRAHARLSARPLLSHGRRRRSRSLHHAPLRRAPPCSVPLRGRRRARPREQEQRQRRQAPAGSHGPAAGGQPAVAGPSAARVLRAPRGQVRPHLLHPPGLQAGRGGHLPAPGARGAPRAGPRLLRPRRPRRGALHLLRRRAEHRVEPRGPHVAAAPAGVRPGDAQPRGAGQRARAPGARVQGHARAPPRPGRRRRARRRRRADVPHRHERHHGHAVGRERRQRQRARRGREGLQAPRRRDHRHARRAQRVRLLPGARALRPAGHPEEVRRAQGALQPDVRQDHRAEDQRRARRRRAPRARLLGVHAQAREGRRRRQDILHHDQRQGTAHGMNMIDPSSTF